MARTIGTSSFGLRAPIIREGDDIAQIVTDTVLNCGIELRDRDIVGITESVVARAQGNYVTVDEVAEDIKRLSNNAEVISVMYPIFSRNRFAMILKAIARAAGRKVVVYVKPIDEVGNPLRNHPFTGMNYDEYYKSLIEGEGKEAAIVVKSLFNGSDEVIGEVKNAALDFSCKIDCRMYSSIVHNPLEDANFSIVDICKDKCDFGLHGSNKSSEEKLKLFPTKAFGQEVVEKVQKNVLEATGKKIEVLVYGDGCYKDPSPEASIWEFFDPVVSPAYTSGLEGTPNEIKIKNFADDKYKDLSGEELNEAIKQEIRTKDANLVGTFTSQGTTPRKYTNLLGSLCDLMSGSGDKATPFILIQGYFDNMSNE